MDSQLVYALIVPSDGILINSDNGTTFCAHTTGPVLSSGAEEWCSGHPSIKSFHRLVTATLASKL